MATAKRPDRTSRRRDSMGELVARHRARGLVGRAREWARLATLLEPDCESPVVLLHGPPGSGKSALLRSLARSASERGVAVLECAGIEPGDRPGHPVTEFSDCDLLLIDDFPFGSTAERVMREDWLTQLPASTRVVLAGRWRPDDEWRTDPGWRSLVAEIALHGLTPAEVGQWLDDEAGGRLRLPEVLKCTAGNPLLVGLIAERLRREPQASPAADDNPGIGNALLRHYLRDCPDEGRETVLHAASLVARLDGDLTRAVLGADTRPPEWDWLIRHPAVIQEPDGVRLPEAVAEFLRVAFKVRAPVRHRQLMERTLLHIGARVKQELSEAVVKEFLYALRELPEFRRAFPIAATDPFHITGAQAADEEPLASIVDRRYGPEAARWFCFWFERAPQRLAVFRDNDGDIHGLSFYLDSDSMDQPEADNDPAVQRFRRHVEKRVVPQPGEATHLCRFLTVDPERPNEETAFTRLRCYNAFYAFRTPGLAFSATVAEDTPAARAAGQLSGVPPLVKSDFEQDGQALILIGHDWRVQPPEIWLRDLVDRMLGSTAVARVRHESPAPPDRDAFDRIVRNTLDALRRGEPMDPGPWRTTRLLANRPLAQDSGEPGEVIRELLTDSIDRLARNPGTATAAHAVHKTYIERAGKQRAVAHDLNLSYGTYRRRLREGLAALVEDLWRQELASINADFSG